MKRNVNEKSLMENLKTEFNHGTYAAVNPVEDFYPRNVAVNSWFAVGHFESEDHKLSCLFHLMSMNRPGAEPVIDSNLSITDETTGWYYGDDQIYPFNQTEIKISSDKDRILTVKVPNGSLTGTLDKMHWHAEMEHGEIDLDMHAYGYPIFNAGSGSFTTCFDKPFNQYSIPNLHTSGSLKLDGKVYEVKGTSWFDRQWQDEGKDFAGTRWNWGWMDLHLDNGDVLSLWDMTNRTYKTNQTWATVQHPDGTQSTCYVEPLAENEHDVWKSEVSGQTYPTGYTVKIPDLDAVLEVKALFKEQELVSKIPFLNKYEGASTVTGTYKGKPCKGYCYVELLGDWS